MLFYKRTGKKNEPKKYVPVTKGYKTSTVTTNKYSGVDEYGRIHKIVETIIRPQKKKKKGGKNV